MRDRPLSFAWRPKEEGTLDALGLPPVLNHMEHTARQAIIAEVFVWGRADPAKRLSYSRRKQHYGGAGEYYASRGVGYAGIVRTVDLLDHAGLVEHDRALPGRFGVQSTIAAKPDLLDTLAGMPVTYDHLDTIVLRSRDEDRRRLSYDDNRLTRAMRNRLATINKAMSATTIAHPDIGLIEAGTPTSFGSSGAAPFRPGYRRIFSGDFRSGGRLYCPIQNLPPCERARLTLDGEDVVEADFPRLHVSMAHEACGVPIIGDPYDIDGFPVATAKLAVNVMFNARSRHAAVCAIEDEVEELRRADADRLVAEIEKKHPRIAGMFFADMGVRFQRYDSDIAEGVTISMLRRGAVTISVHDSFVTKRRDKGLLLECMFREIEKASSKLVSPLGSLRIDPLAEVRIDPHDTGGRGGRRDRDMMDSIISSSPISSPSLILTDSPQLELFRNDKLSISAVTIFDEKCGGVLSEEFCVAVVATMKRQGIRQEVLAARLGVRQPHLSNVLRRHDPASPAVADGLRAFLVEHGLTVRMN